MKRSNKIKSLLFAAVLTLVAAFVVACNKKGTATGIAITDLPENNVAVITDAGNTLQLGVKRTGGGGSVQWRSGDTDVATVDGNGKVTLVDGGAAVITVTLAKNAQVKSEVLLTVKDERTVTDTITLAGMPTGNTAQFGDGSVQLSASCSNAAAKLVWISSNDGVATVNDNGLVTFTGGGTTDITVYKKGQRAVKATATLTVVRKVESLTIADVEGGAIVAGRDYRLGAPYTYALQTEHTPWNASPFALTWSVNNANIAEIDAASGVITGKQSGNVVVTAKIENGTIEATKEFTVVRLDEKSENFAYAVPNRYYVNGVCTDAWLDYTGTKVTTQNTDVFIDTYDTNKKMLVVEKNTDYKHWSQVCLGGWDLQPGKYTLTVDLTVTEGEFEGKISGAQYLDSPAEYEKGIRADAVANLDFGKLSEITPTNGKYVITFETRKRYKEFGVLLYDDNATAEPYALQIKSFSLVQTDMGVETDAYDDGKLVIGEEYTFVPGAIEGCAYSYTWSGASNIVKLENGKLIPVATGSGAKLEVSTTYNGRKLSKKYEFSVIANPFKANEDDYAHATEAQNRGKFVYDVRRTSVYTRTNNLILSVEAKNGGGQTLKLVHDYAKSWEGSVQFMLGKVEKGTYNVSFTLRGDDMDKWEKFHGHIYPIVWEKDYRNIFAFGNKEAGEKTAYTRGAREYGDIYNKNCVKNGNTYTYTVTVDKDTENFGIELCGGTEVDYTIYLDAFKFESMPEIASADIDGIVQNVTLNSGATVDLQEKVTYQGGAESGQKYTCEWSVASDGINGGSARIIDGADDKKQLQVLKPGKIVLTLRVQSVTGEIKTATRNITVQLVTLPVTTNMYADGLLVKGAKYTFAPLELYDGMQFTYSYKTAQDATTTTVTSEIAEVKDGKLFAKSAGSVWLVVSSTVDGSPVNRTFAITVKEYGGTTDANYNDAVAIKRAGDANGWSVYDVERTNVYLRTFNMTAAVENNGENKTLKLAQDTNSPTAWRGSVLFGLGNVKAGTYTLRFTLHGSDVGVWDKWQGHLYPIAWQENWQTAFTQDAYKRSGVSYGNLFDTHCLTTDTTYTYVITLAEDANNFGIELDGGAPTGYTIYLDGFAFEKLHGDSSTWVRNFTFESESKVVQFKRNNTLLTEAAGADNSVVWMKNASNAHIAESGANNHALKLTTLATDNWTEIVFRVGAVTAGTYTFSYHVEMLAGGGWFSGHIYTFTYNADGTWTSAEAANAHSNIGGGATKDGTFEITLENDVADFGIALCNSCNVADVTVLLDNVSFASKA